MADSTVIMKASVRGARRAAHSITSSGRQIQTVLLNEMSDLGPTGLRIYRSYAPHRSGRLERGLKASVRSYGGRISVQIESTARSDEGYDYLPVTRYGHRVPIIYPKHAKALKIPLASGTIFRAWVRGYKPSRDWAEDAFRAVEVELDRVAASVGRAIDRSLR